MAAPPVVAPAPSAPPTAAPSAVTMTHVPTPVPVAPAPEATAAALAAAGAATAVPTQVAAATAAPTEHAVAAPPKPATKASSKKKKSQVTVTMATAANAQSGSQGSQGENTGRWTAEEHRLFLQGLELHGKGWKKIAGLIKSRTVVQIRTHAQKYFQKLAKAKQNGEEGEILMEGRGGTASVPSVSTSAAQTNKRRKQTSGTKRKAIQSVVSSAQREAKKHATGSEELGAGVSSVAPALAPYVMPPVVNPMESSGNTQTSVPSITTAHGTISGTALEDSLFRYLSPVPVAPQEQQQQVNEVARQAGANPITVPVDQPTVTAPAVGEVSPTGVADLAMYPSWTDAKDTPSWYAKGSDVDALLDVAESLDWWADTGDLNETYQEATNAIADDIPAPTPVVAPAPGMIPSAGHEAGTRSSMSMNTLSQVDHGTEVVVPPLPSLFDGAADGPADEPNRKVGLHGLHQSPSVPNLDEHLQVFDTPIEEHDFVSTILDDHAPESSASLAALASS